MDIRRIGLTDAEHTSGGVVPVQQGDAYFVNESGQASGYSRRYAKGFGESAWSWSIDAGPTRINPADGAHVSKGGEITGDPLAMNASGRVVGVSRVYSPSSNTQFGADAWVWTAEGGMIAIGYSDPVDTAPAYTRWGQPGPVVSTVTPGTCINASGAVIGSYRHMGSSPGGFHATYAWVWSETLGNVRLGLLDADHTQIDGTLQSVPVSINDAGSVIGVSDRKSLPSGVGRSAWIWTGGQNYTRLGFIDGVHVAPDGYQYSLPQALTPGGRVAGSSKRFIGALNGGLSAWVWSAESGTQQVGPVDASHVRADGFQNIDMRAIDDSGRMYGTADRYLGSQTVGHETWFKAPGTTHITVGLSDAVHVGPSGGISSEFKQMNASAQAAGNSVRFAGGNSAGRSAWFYDPESNTIWPLIFSVSSAGVANTTVTFLTDSGIVGGYYELYQGATLLGTRPFLWSVANGLADFETLVDGGLGSHGWTALQSIEAGSNAGYFVGMGTHASNPSGTSAFILSPHRCLADRNRDDHVALDDFMNYFTCWDASAPCADVDDAPGVDLGDFFAFLGHWDAGC